MKRRPLFGAVILVCLCLTVTKSYAWPLPPVAVIDGSYYKYAHAGTPKEFTAYGSYDPDGGDIEWYYWGFPGYGYTESDPSVTHTFQTGGVYYIDLRVRDDEGTKSEYTYCKVYAVEDVNLSGGGYVALNDDDDDDDGVVDYDDGYNQDGIPGNEDDTNPDEDDLVPITLSFDPSYPTLNSGMVELKKIRSGDGDVKVWYEDKKVTEVTLPKRWLLSRGPVPSPLYVEGTATSSSLNDVQLKLRFIDPYTWYTIDYDTTEFSSSYFELDSLTICKPTGDDWATLPWDQVLLEDETLRIKANVNPPLPTGGDFSVDVTARTSYTKPDGITVTLGELADGGSELRGTTSTSSLIDSGGGGPEFTSADNASGSGSNFNDSDQFDADMASPNRKQRGKARNGGNENASPPEGGVTKTFMRAAGVEYVEIIYNEGAPTEKKDKNQIENQADSLYFSGHGSHNTGGVVLYSPASSQFGPSDVSGGTWESDLGTVIFAACAVFDVDDLNYNYSSTGDGDGDGIVDHDESPGEAWATTAPNYFLGYNYISPLDHWHGDPEFTAKIIHKWYSDTEHSIFEAWGQANKYYADGLDDRPWNACAIDARPSYKTYYYWDKGVTYHSWTDYSF
jgi:hypothetical protein